MQQRTSVFEHPVIALLTDFGLTDGYVGIMKGVMLGIAPGAQLVDLTHDVAPQDLAEGAWQLAISYRYFPAGTVFVCVVDPGVGSQRQSVAVHAGSWYFVGPDNGLFSAVLEQQPVHAVVALSNPAYHLPQVSTTFHGRDIFAPVAAHLASGVALTDLGVWLDPASLQRRASETPQWQGGQLVARVVHIDRFGNIISNIALEMVPTLFSSPTVQLRFPAQQRVITARRRYFAEHDGDADDPFIYPASSGYLAVAVRNGDAARLLGVHTGDAAMLSL